ncbi:MAG: DUF4115 domain-containing protein [Candidatus Omnitrophica bacterium]|nr:DUF4115 domain-containing protein [Candidatus Omnitrophota bacterium]
MTIGNTLKSARQAKHLSLEDIFEKTRIHPHVLSALEEDRYDKILNSAYIRSFLREYSTYLSLDTRMILAEYDKAHPKDKQQIVETPPEEEKGFAFPQIDLIKAVRTLTVIAGSILVVMALIFLLKTTGKAFKSISQYFKDKKPPKVTEPAKPKKAKPKKSRPEKKVAAKPKGAPKQAAQDIAQERPPVSAKSPIPAGETLKLTIGVTEDVWIQLQVDGRIIFQNAIKKDSSETWEAQKEFKIWTGNGIATHLTLNGRELGSLGRGVKKDLVVTRKGLKR